MDVAPTARLPFASIEKREAPDEEAIRRGLVVPVLRTVSVALGEVVPIPTVTASDPVPPRMRLLERATREFLPMAVMLVRAVVEAIDASRDDWKPRKVTKSSIEEFLLLLSSSPVPAIYPSAVLAFVSE